MRGEIKRNLDKEEQQQPSKPCCLPSAEKGERNKQRNAGPLGDGAAEQLRPKENLTLEQY